MFEALLYGRTGGGGVRCGLCPHRCAIADGRRGLCGVRENMGGTLYSVVYGKPCAVHADPIEKKPLYHFLPGTLSYSIATVGCNLRCRHCQNYEISQMPRLKGGIIAGDETSPEEVVSGALAAGCSSVAYTYTEPTIFMEYALDISKLAEKAGLKNVFVSNGYMTEEAVELISPHLHADNVDLKSFSDRFYRENCGASLEPVLKTLKSLVRRKVWVEVTTLIIPTLNDGEDELREIAGFISGELGDHVPWHVSRFHPDFELTGIAPTDVEAIRTAVGIGREEGLKYVYAGNVPHGDYENTHCSKCGGLLVERQGFTVTANRVSAGRCADCGTAVEGVWS
jgi:pyruvate formate lyase activating enzyme